MNITNQNKIYDLEYMKTIKYALKDLPINRDARLSN